MDSILQEADMYRRLATGLVFVLVLASFASAGQVPYASTAPDVPVSHRDRVYTADQFSNTVSVIDPADNKLLGMIRLGEPAMATTPSGPAPGTLSPLYRDQLLVHGLGFSPDRRTVVVISITTNSATFVDTETNTVKHLTYFGRAPHEAFFTPDGKEVWASIRGANYVAVLDGRTYLEKARIMVPNGPGMAIFSPDGTYGYVCSSFTPETVVISVARRTIVGRVKQVSPFCPNIAATPDGRQVWLTLKDTGKTMVFNARPPFNVLRVLDTGPITNHVNIVRNAHGQFAYVTVGGLDQVKVFRTDDFQLVATIPVGTLPHGIWPSGDGTRIYVALEQGGAVTVIDTLTNKQIATVPVGQATQALVYVPDAVRQGNRTRNLESLGAARGATQFVLVDAAGRPGTHVTLFDQGFVQILQAAVTGLQPGQVYVLALSTDPKGAGSAVPLAAFMTNPAGAAIVNAVGPIRQYIAGRPKHYLVITGGSPAQLGRVMQVQGSSPR
jgi:YVTN family beta-propeller protein